MRKEVLYFAYGSNMSTRRLRNRIDAQVVGTGYLPEHRLCFHKKWACGSGKCDGLYTGNTEDRLWGVVYAISASDLGILDTIECKDVAYERKTIKTTLSTGEVCLPEVYVGNGSDVDTSALPFCWYKHHVQFGAQENSLPSDYIASMITPIQTTQDPDQDRYLREYGIYPELKSSK